MFFSPDDVDAGVSSNDKLSADDILMREGRQQKLDSNEPKAKQKQQQQQQKHQSHPNAKTHPNKMQQVLHNSIILQYHRSQTEKSLNA